MSLYESAKGIAAEAFGWWFVPSALHLGYTAAMHYGSPEIGNRLAFILPAALATRYISQDEGPVGERVGYGFAETLALGCGSVYGGFLFTEGVKLASQLF